MKYICAQPGTRYYAWQIEIMLMNFKEMGIPLQDVHIVCAMHDQNALHLYHQISNQYPEAVIEFYPLSVFNPTKYTKAAFFQTQIE
jgi:hypothetical protein